MTSLLPSSMLQMLYSAQVQPRTFSPTPQSQGCDFTPGVGRKGYLHLSSHSLSFLLWKLDFWLAWKRRLFPYSGFHVQGRGSMPGEASLENYRILASHGPTCRVKASYQEAHLKKMGATIPTFQPVLVGWRYHSGSIWPPTHPHSHEVLQKFCSGGQARLEYQQLSSSTEGTQLIWNRAWRTNSLRCCQKQQRYLY